MILNPIHRGILSAVLVFGTMLVLAQSPSGAVQISIMVSQRSEAHNAALTAFLQVMEESQQIETITYNLGGNVEMGIEVAKWIMKRRPDFVLAVGTTAALAAKKELTGIPIVFCMVLNPVSSGLVKHMKSPGDNVTGASLDILLETQYKHIKMLIPDAKSIGVIYNPDETGILVQEAVKVAKSRDISLTAKAISSEREIPDALESILDKEDILWSVADGTVFSPQSTQYILLTTLRARVPFMGLSPAFVKAGALMALSCDYTDIGKQAAEIAMRILDGENPGDIPIAVPRKISLHINLRTAEHIGLNIPKSAIRLASEVIR